MRPPNTSGTRSSSTSCIRRSQLSRSRHATQPHSCSLHPATHCRAPSSTSDTISGAAAAPSRRAALTPGAAMHLVQKRLQVSAMRTTSLTLGKKRTMPTSFFSSAIPSPNSPPPCACHCGAVRAAIFPSSSARRRCIRRSYSSALRAASSSSRQTSSSARAAACTMSRRGWLAARGCSLVFLELLWVFSSN